MIKPEELKSLPVETEAQIRELEAYVITETVKAANDPHLAETGITLAILAKLRRIERRIAKMVQKINATSSRNIQRAIEKSIQRELNAAKAAGKDPHVSTYTTRMKNTALDEAKTAIENLTGSMGFHDSRGRIQPIGRIYIAKLNEAAISVQSGALDYKQATRKVCEDLAQHGLYTVYYASGHKDRMDVAARRAIITGANQTAARVTEGLIDDLSAEYVETTAHLGARPDHQVWQGQVFSYRGADPRYPDFVESTNYGDVTGLCGANCRHNFFIYWPGSSTRAYTDEELADMNPIVSDDTGREMTYYEASQKQRAQEREMRKSKRLITAYEAAGLDEDLELTLAKLARQKQKYRQFSRAVGIRTKFERTEL